MINKSQDIREQASSRGVLNFRIENSRNLSSSVQLRLNSAGEAYNVASNTLIAPDTSIGSFQPAFSASSSLRIPTPSGILTLLSTKIEELGNTTHWFGIIEGDPNSIVTLVMQDQAISGSIKSMNSDYILSSVNDAGLHSLSLIDRSKTPTKVDFDESGPSVQGITSDPVTPVETTFQPQLGAPIRLGTPTPKPELSTSPMPLPLPSPRTSPSPAPSVIPQPSTVPSPSPTAMPAPSVSPSQVSLYDPIVLPEAPNRPASVDAITKVKVLVAVTSNADSTLNHQASARAAAAINEANLINNRSGILVQYELAGTAVMPSPPNYDVSRTSG